MKKIILGILCLLSINLMAQQLSYTTIKNESIELTLLNGTLTVKNLTKHPTILIMINTTEDTVWLKKNEEKVIHEMKGRNFIGARDLKGCNCWLQLITDCTLLPLKISNVVIKGLKDNRIEISFDAFNTTPGDSNSFYLQYSKDNGKTFNTIKVDVPNVTSLSQHFIKTIKLPI